VATKADRLSGNRLKVSLNGLAKAFGAELTAYSSKTGAGRDELWRVIRASIAG
jgi:hypothetical protein